MRETHLLVLAEERRGDSMKMWQDTCENLRGASLVQCIF